MFQLGLEYYHIRKPKFSRREMAQFIEAFPERYRDRLVLHAYHSLAFHYKLGGIHLSRKHRKRGRMYFFRLFMKRLLKPNLVVTRSFHKLTAITSDKRKYTYVFLSPVFDSISNSSLSAGFSKRALAIINREASHNVIALGGVGPEHMKLVKELGFAGAAMLGSLWKEASDPVAEYKKASESAFEASKTARLAQP